MDNEIPATAAAPTLAELADRMAAAAAVPVRRNINESVPRDWTEQELRGGALRDALSYFTYVTSRAPGTGPASPPVGITTVLEIADHFAAYVRDGSKPQKEATDGT